MPRCNLGENRSSCAALVLHCRRFSLVLLQVKAMSEFRHILDWMRHVVTHEIGSRIGKSIYRCEQSETEMTSVSESERAFKRFRKRDLKQSTRRVRLLLSAA